MRGPRQEGGPVMSSKTKQSGRVDILVRMPPELKLRVIRAAETNGVSVNGWLNYAISQVLAFHDAEVAADEKRKDLERLLQMKFEEIVTALAGGDLALSARERVDFEAAADIALSKLRDPTGRFFNANPATLLERLCQQHDDIEAELEDAKRLDTFGDEALDHDEPEPADPDDVAESDAGDESDAAGGE